MLDKNVYPLFLTKVRYLTPSCFFSLSHKHNVLEVFFKYRLPFIFRALTFYLCSAPSGKYAHYSPFTLYFIAKLGKANYAVNFFFVFIKLGLSSQSELSFAILTLTYFTTFFAGHFQTALFFFFLWTFSNCPFLLFAFSLFRPQGPQGCPQGCPQG